MKHSNKKLFRLTMPTVLMLLVVAQLEAALSVQKPGFFSQMGQYFTNLYKSFGSNLSTIKKVDSPNFLPTARSTEKLVVEKNWLTYNQ